MLQTFDLHFFTALVKLASKGIFAENFKNDDDDDDDNSILIY
jgi:hypothetical protein